MNEQTTSVVGIDVSKRKLDIALLANSKTKSKVFDNASTGHNELSQWLLERGARPEHTHICMEATGPYSEAVAIALVEAGWRVSVVNPARIKGFAQGELARNKTDRADASLLARFCAAMHPSLWTPPSAEWRELRGWVDRLQSLKDMHQQESNRLEAHTATGQAFLMESVQTHLDWLVQQIRALERDIDDHINRYPELKRDAELLHSIPGIGNTTVAKVLAYAGDVRRFANAKALAAFIGVTPRQRLSGSSVKGRTVMSRTGHADLRRALYMPGLVARRHNPILRIFGDRLKANGLAPKAVIGAVMRKLAHLIYGVIKSGLPFDPSFSGLRLDLQDGI
ncbi:MAG: IS110 family transposase [Nitrosomonadales bacterium]